MPTRWILLSLVLIVALASCTSGRADEPKPSVSATSPTPVASTGSAYVALGDSFVAGPGINTIDPGSEPCMRSDHNYPSVLAKELDLALRDASCAGASTTDLLEPSVQGSVPRQIDAITPSTSLVTVGVGANDGALFLSLLRACANTPVGTCESFIRTGMPAVLAKTSTSLVGVLEAITKRAPRAEVVLVGYLRLAPKGGVCEDIPVRGAALASVRTAEQAIDTTLAGAARTAGVDFVSMRKASSGHDVCSGKDAWVNGISAPTGDGIVLHPNAAGMREVAAAIAEKVGN